MTIETASFPVGAASHNTIARAIDKWDLATIPGSGFGTTHAVGSATSGGLGDGRNSVARVDLGGQCNASTKDDPLALTVSRIRHGVIVEADLYLSDSCEFATRMDYYDFNDPVGIEFIYAMEPAVLHEMGHVAGFAEDEAGEQRGACVVTQSDGGHENCLAWEIKDYDGYPTLMHPIPDASAAIGDLGTNGPSWSVRRNYAVGENERVGLRQLYPNTGSIGHDVAAASYSFPDDEIFRGTTGDPKFRCIYNTTEGRTRPSPHVDWFARAQDENIAGYTEWDCPLDNSTNILPPLLIARLFGAARPAIVNVSAMFSLLELGTLTDTVEWRLQLQSSLKGGPGPFVLRTGTAQVRPDVPDEKQFNARTVTRGIPAGLYNLVLLLDPASLDNPRGLISETDETNNVAIWNRQIQLQ